MKAMPKAMIISGLIVGAIFMFLLGSFVPGVGGLIQGLFMLAAILFGAMVPVLAASLMLAVKAIYDEAVPFKASYLMMSIVLACTAGFMIVTIRLGLNPLYVYLGQFLVGAYVIGRFIEIDEESIGIVKGGVISIISTVIFYVIWYLVGAAILTALGAGKMFRLSRKQRVAFAWAGA